MLICEAKTLYRNIIKNENYSNGLLCHLAHGTRVQLNKNTYV